MDTASERTSRKFSAPYNQAVELLKETTRTRRAAAGDGVELPGAQPIQYAQPARGASPAQWLMRGMVGWHLTSLDAPTVAVVWCEALARIVNVRLPLWVPLALGLGTWAIYLGDRLMDARRALAPLRERHWFHWRHRSILAPVAVISLLLALSLVLREMPAPIRERNSVLALAALVYFTAIHSRRRTAEAAATGGTRSTPRLPLTKETLVGLIFALVCAAPAATRSAHGLALLVAPVAGCFLLAWLNCWLIEHWDGGVSVGVTLPLTLSGLALAAAAVAVALQGQTAGAFLAALGLSALALAWLDQKQARLEPLHLRAAADLVLLTPLLLPTLRIPALAPTFALLLRGWR